MKERDDWEQRFANYLSMLVDRQDRGALAALRRGLGKRPGEAPEVFPYVVPWVGNANRAQELAAYLVASLVAFHPSWAEDDEHQNLGASWRAARLESTSSELQFVALLNANQEDLDHHLRRAIGVLKAHGIPWNWAQLLRDIRHWDSKRRWVQQAWARSYWGAEASTSEGGMML